MKYTERDVGAFLEKAKLADINKWIMRYPNLLYKYASNLDNRLHNDLRIKITDRVDETVTMPDVLFFTRLIMTRPRFTEVEYTLLNTITNCIVKPSTDGSDCLAYITSNPKEGAILLAMLDIEDIKDGIVQRFGESYNAVVNTFLQFVIDVYIPTEEPSELIDAFRDIMVDFTELGRQVNNTDWIYERLKVYSLIHRIDGKSIILLFKIISDIYTNIESSFEFMKSLHRLLTTAYAVRKEINVIYDRYKDYFRDGEAYAFITMILDYMTQVGADNSNVQKRIKEDFAYYQDRMIKPLTQDVLKCMIGDIWNMIQRRDIYKDRLHQCRYMGKELLYSWPKPKVTPVVDEPTTEALSLSSLDVDLDSIAMEAVHKDSAAMNAAEKKIYKAYRVYQDAEEKVDSQITKAVNAFKGGGKDRIRTQIIEGKKFSVIGLLKRVLKTVGLFSIGPVKAVIMLVIQFALNKKTTEAERRKIIMELDTEIQMITEKIEDARSDQNRQAKYAMMRTKIELENAKKRIQFGMEADEKSLRDTNAALKNARAERTV